MKKLSISVVIVNYEAWDKLKNCLDSLNFPLQDLLIREVIVVDNSSPTDLLENFKVKYPQYTFIRNTGNNGFSNGCNLGAQEAIGNTYLFLKLFLF